MTTHQRFALHPGFVVSMNDGTRHFIGPVALARLYELNPGEWFVWAESHSTKADQFIHLHPRHDGKYERPTL